jgi:hypothetical protein
VIDTEVETGLPRAEGGPGAHVCTRDRQRGFLVDLCHLMLRAKGQRGVHAALPEGDIGIGLGVVHPAGCIEQPGVNLGRGSGSSGQCLIDAGVRVPQSRRRFTVRSGTLKICHTVPDAEHRALVIADVRFPSSLGAVPLSSPAHRPHCRQPPAVRRCAIPDDFLLESARAFVLGVEVLMW